MHSDSLPELSQSLDSEMSISSGIHVYVRHFDDAFITDEYRIKLTPHPLNWLSTINAMHQLFVANGATIDHDTFLRTLQVYLSIDGFLAKVRYTHLIYRTHLKHLL